MPYWLTFNEAKGSNHVLFTVLNIDPLGGIEAPALDLPERVHEPLHERDWVAQGFLSSVHVLRPEGFKSGEPFNSVLFHELTHSARHRALARRGHDP